MTQEKMNKMLSKIMITAVLTSGLLFAGANSIMAQVVRTGGVGESGPNSMVVLQVTGQRDVRMVIRTTETSLCPNTAAVAVLLVNGVPVEHGDISARGSSIEVSAKP